MRQIAITSHKQAELVETADPSGPLKPQEVRGRTLVSLVSPGTELNWAYLSKEGFPHYTGYACVVEITELGSEVTDLKPGDLVLASLNHCEKQQCLREAVVPLPPGLKPEAAVFARLAGVSMTTLNTTAAHPPARVLITGLGPVGNLAAQNFNLCGYDVTAVDPVESRRKLAAECGIKDVRASVDEGSPDIVGKVSLHIECSGHEKAAMDGCRAVRKRGEVVLLGTPWVRRTDIFAYDLLRAVFHGYVVLRSGWEWETPGQPRDFTHHSIVENFAAAMEWLRDRRLKVDALAGVYPPTDVQAVYSGLLVQSLPTPAAIFDWR